MLDEPLQLVLTLLLVVEGVQQILGQRHGDFSETFQGLEIWLKDKVTFSHWKEALKGSRPFKNPLFCTARTYAASAMVTSTWERKKLGFSRRLQFGELFCWYKPLKHQCLIGE